MSRTAWLAVAVGAGYVVAVWVLAMAGCAVYAEPDFCRPEKCRKMIDKVLRWNPKVPSEAIEEMKLEMENLKEKL